MGLRKFCSRFCGSGVILALSLLAEQSQAQVAPGPTPESSRPVANAGEAETLAEPFSLHGQATNVTQYHPPFTSPFQGTNSLSAGHSGAETTDATLFAGIRLWHGLEAYADPEVDQGFGLSDTVGVAGFPSGEAYKVGAAEPYVRLQRAFLRDTIDLGGATQRVAPDANQLGGTRSADNLIFTAGKFSVVDIFDTNAYAHDPLGDFLNWSIIDAGAFDYAADAWGYTYGGVAEWNQSRWSLRGGLFDLSKQPNSKDLERGFGQFETDLEAEERHQLFAQPGKLKLLAFLNDARMGDYSAAVRLAQETGTRPDVALVRRRNFRPGAALNLEQQIADDLGVFARLSWNEGDKETYEFTEINRSASGGLSLKGTRWSRPDDTVGLAGAINDISKAARNYLAAGGLGILIGDGQLPRAGFEKIIETYYQVGVTDWLDVAVDYQHIDNPGYDALRGPMHVFGLRVHAEF